MTLTPLKIWNPVMKTAYLDCFSGISGDMFLGALLDAGLHLEDLKKGLQTLPLTGYSLHAEKAERSHITGTRFVVNVEEKEQKARHLGDIRGLIEQANLSDRVREKSIEIFEAPRSHMPIFIRQVWSNTPLNLAREQQGILFGEKKSDDTYHILGFLHKPQLYLHHQTKGAFLSDEEVNQIHAWMGIVPSLVFHLWQVIFWDADVSWSVTRGGNVQNSIGPSRDLTSANIQKFSI